MTRVVVLALAAALSLSAEDAPRFRVREAPLIQMPGVAVPERSLEHDVDSNSPLHWDGDTLYLFNSYAHPWRSSGPDLEHLGNRISTHLGKFDDKAPLWIEATWRDDDGTLYGAYHFEPHAVCFANQHLPTAPRIGWLRSRDNGATWKDLGFILTANPCALKCGTRSRRYAGGNGDFVFLRNRDRQFFYFYGTSYDPDAAAQGVFVARMRYADRNAPAGKVLKWRDGEWNEPGLWGRVTPVFAAARDYHGKGGSMFWGPSIHWNTYLNMYVMVLNHTRDSGLTSDGVFLSFARGLGDPAGWSKPVKALDRGGAYPQIAGTAKGETDKVCGRTCRIFLAGRSELEITFYRPGEEPK